MITGKTITDNRAYINIGALALLFLINYLSNAIPFNQLTQTDLSDLYPVLITPAGYVFSIWGLIYLLLTAFVIYQALPAYRNTPAVTAVGLLFALTCLFNILWLFAWHYLQVGLAFIIMLLLLSALVAIYLRLRQIPGEPLFDKILVKLTFSIYVAWISVAAIVNFNILLYHVGWLGAGGFGAGIFTMLMLIFAAFIAGFIFLKYRDLAFPLVFVWALAGIAMRHGAEFILVTITAWILAAAIIFYLGWMSAQTTGPGPDRKESNGDGSV